ncbi:MAG TPA: IS1 family transposase [Pyrinomonadaceae bacterium]|nr:IS1 family transposase [Pyrinomonadaceae bacterium]
MNRLPIAKRKAILGMLVEGNSLRATSRLCDVSINTLTKLLVDLGSASADYQDKTLRNLRCRRIQCDEIWAFVYAKEKNVPADKRGQFGYGDVWTWTAIDAETKLVPSFMVANRDVRSATMFIDDLKSRLAGRVQLTTDGLRVYLEAVEGAFGADIDYAQLVKIYGASQEETRYSPAECIGCERKSVTGNPDPKHVSTSFAERQNLTMRMGMRRFTRLTNAFSKKVENHAYQVALHFMHYNFARVHASLRVTPAMEAGVSDHVWSLEEISDLAK